MGILIVDLLISEQTKTNAATSTFKSLKCYLGMMGSRDQYDVCRLLVTGRHLQKVYTQYRQNNFSVFV